MQLHEEYIVRHGLSVPVIRYNTSTRVLLDNGEDGITRWSVFSVEWVYPEHPPHPGYFERKDLIPFHNGHNRGRCFQERNRKRVILSEYEAYLMTWVRMAKQARFRLVTERKEMELACWEILLYSHDLWLSNNCNSDFFDDVEVSLNRHTSISERFAAYLRAKSVLPSDVKEIFKYNILLPLVLDDDSSEWIQALWDKKVSAA